MNAQTEYGVNLDTMFRKDSKARTVAERLLTGKPQSRAELVKGLNLSMTTVPRVIEVLKGAGVEIDRETDRTRQAVYRVVGSTVSSVHDDIVGEVVARYAHVAGEPVRIKIQKVEVVEGAVWVEWFWERAGTYRGRLLDIGGSVAIPSTLFAGEAEIVAITIMSKGQFGVRIGDDRSSVLVAQITPIDAPPLWGP